LTSERQECEEPKTEDERRERQIAAILAAAAVRAIESAAKAQKV